MPALSIDEAMKNPLNRVILTSPANPKAKYARWGLEAFLTQEVSLQSNSTYTSDGQASSVSKFNTKIEQATALANRFGFAIDQPKVFSVTSSMLTWEGSGNFAFSLPLAFYAVKADDDVREPIRILADAIYPSISNIASINLASILTPPLGYRRGNAKTPTGVIALSIGKWFKVPALLVIESISPVFSKEVISSGSPLYATVTVAFKAARIISADEYKSFYPSLNV